MTQPSSTQTALRWKTLTPGNETLVPTPAALFCQVAGDVTITGDDGQSETFTLIQGQVLECRPIKLTAATATVKGLYNEPYR